MNDEWILDPSSTFLSNPSSTQPQPQPQQPQQPTTSPSKSTSLVKKTGHFFSKYTKHDGSKSSDKKDKKLKKAMKKSSSKSVSSGSPSTEVEPIPATTTSVSSSSISKPSLAQSRSKSRESLSFIPHRPRSLSTTSSSAITHHPPPSTASNPPTTTSTSRKKSHTPTSNTSSTLTPPNNTSTSSTISSTSVSNNTATIASPSPPSCSCSFFFPPKSPVLLASSRIPVAHDLYKPLRDAARSGALSQLYSLCNSPLLPSLAVALDEGRTLLHLVCQSAAIPPRLSSEFVQYLCHCAPSLPLLADDRGQTAAHYAAQIPSFPALLALAAAGASFADYNPEGLTPLHYLAMSPAEAPLDDPAALQAFMERVPAAALDLPTAATAQTFLHLLLQRPAQRTQQMLFRALMPRLHALDCHHLDYKHYTPLDYLKEAIESSSSLTSSSSSLTSSSMHSIEISSSSSSSISSTPNSISDHIPTPTPSPILSPSPSPSPSLILSPSPSLSPPLSPSLSPSLTPPPHPPPSSSSPPPPSHHPSSSSSPPSPSSSPPPSPEDSFAATALSALQAVPARSDPHFSAQLNRLLRALSSLDLDLTLRLLSRHPELLKMRNASGVPLHFIPLLAQQPLLAAPLHARLVALCLALLAHMARLDRFPSCPDGSHFLVAQDPRNPPLPLLHAYLLLDPAALQRPSLQGIHPLHAAAFFRRLDAVELLLRCGADPNAGDSSGNTPLHLACLRADLDAAAALLRAGCDAAPRNAQGQTPRELLAWTCTRSEATAAIERLLLACEACAAASSSQLRLRGMALGDAHAELLLLRLLALRRLQELRAVDLSGNKLSAPPPLLQLCADLDLLDLSQNWAAEPLKLGRQEIRQMGLPPCPRSLYDQLFLAPKPLLTDRVQLAAVGCDLQGFQSAFSSASALPAQSPANSIAGRTQLTPKAITNSLRETFAHAACMSALSPGPSVGAQARIAFLEFLVERFKISLTQLDVNDISPLMIACQGGCLPTIAFLLERGARANQYPLTSRVTVLHTLAALHRPSGDLALLEAILQKVLAAAPSLLGVAAAVTNNLPLHELLSNPSFSTSPFLQAMFATLLEHSTAKALTCFNSAQLCCLLIAANNSHNQALELIFKKSLSLNILYPHSLLTFLNDSVLLTSTIQLISQYTHLFEQPLSSSSSSSTAIPPSFSWIPDHLYCAMGQVLQLRKIHDAAKRDKDSEQLNMQQHDNLLTPDGGNTQLSFLRNDSRGWSPVHFATLLGHKSVLLFIRSIAPDYYTANLNRCVPDGFNALHLAVYLANHDLVEFFLDDPRDPPDINKYTSDLAPKTPLALAISRGHIDLARYLLAQGANPSLPELTFSRSAVHLAALAHSGTLITAIVAHDPGTLVLFDHPDSLGYTPAQLWLLQDYRHFLMHSKSQPMSTRTAFLPFFKAIDAFFSCLRAHPSRHLPIAQVLLSCTRSSASSSTSTSPSSSFAAPLLMELDLSKMSLDETQANILLEAIANNNIIKLTRIDLRSNALRSVPLAVAHPKHTALTEIHLGDNPYATLIQSKLSHAQDPAVYREYLRLIDLNPFMPLIFQRVVVFGLPGSGKTSLIRSLCERLSMSSNDHRAKWLKSMFEVDKTSCVFRMLSSNLVMFQNVIFEFWEVPYRMRFSPVNFITKETIFLLLWNTKCPLASDHAALLDHISRRQRHPRVLLVGTYANSSNISDIALSEIIQPLKKNFPSLMDGCAVDCGDESGIPHLKSLLYRTAVVLRPMSGLCQFDLALLKTLIWQHESLKTPMMLFQQLLDIVSNDPTFSRPYPNLPFDLKIIRSLQRLSRAGWIVFSGSFYQQKLRLASRTLRSAEDHNVASRVQNDLLVVLRPYWFFDFIHALSLNHTHASASRVLRTQPEFQQLWTHHAREFSLAIQRKLFTMVCSLFLICPLQLTHPAEFTRALTSPDDSSILSSSSNSSHDNISHSSSSFRSSQMFFLNADSESESSVPEELLGNAVGLFGLQAEVDDSALSEIAMGSSTSVQLNVQADFFFLPALLPDAAPDSVMQYWPHGPSNEINVLLFERTFSLNYPIPQSCFIRILSRLLLDTHPRYLWKDGGIFDIPKTSKFYTTFSSTSVKKSYPTLFQCQVALIPRDVDAPPRDADFASSLAWTTIDVPPSWSLLHQETARQLNLSSVLGFYTASTFGAVDAIDLLRPGDCLLVRGVPLLPVISQFSFERSCSLDMLMLSMHCTCDATNKDEVLASASSCCAFAAATIEEISTIIDRCIWLDMYDEVAPVSALPNAPDLPRTEGNTSLSLIDESEVVTQIAVPCPTCRLKNAADASSPLQLFQLSDLSRMIASGSSRIDCSVCSAASACPSTPKGSRGSVICHRQPSQPSPRASSSGFIPVTSRRAAAELDDALKLDLGIAAPSDAVSIRRIAPDLYLAHVREMIEDSSAINLGEELGQGGYGNVYHCQLDDLSSSSIGCAVKSLLDPSAFKDFRTECARLSQFRHANIVSLVAFSLSPTPLLLMELAPGGDVYMLLHDPFRVRSLLDGLQNKLSMLVIERDQAKATNPAFAGVECQLEFYRGKLHHHIDQIHQLKAHLGADIGLLIDSLLQRAQAFFLSPTPDNHRQQFLISSSIVEAYTRSLDTITPLSWDLRLRIAVDALRALVYLHSLQPQPIAHLDFKTPNLLLKRVVRSSSADPSHAASPLILVCDFGFSAPCDPFLFSQDTPSLPPDEILHLHPALSGITPRWSPPEVLAGGLFHLHTDIYAFGLVLWELLLREAPYADLSQEDGFEEAKILNAVLAGQHPHIPPTCPRPISKLLLRCWQKDPLKRPPATFVLDKLMRAVSKISPQLYAQLLTEK